MEPSFAGQYTPSTFLTWLKAENMPDALKEWTGEIIYKRGLDYWKKNKVIDISLTQAARQCCREQKIFNRILSGFSRETWRDLRLPV